MDSLDTHAEYVSIAAAAVLSRRRVERFAVTRAVNWHGGSGLDHDGAEGVVVVLVLVAGEDAVDARPDHLQDGVLDEDAVAGVVEGVREGPSEPDALVELADRKQPGVTGRWTLGRPDD